MTTPTRAHVREAMHRGVVSCPSAASGLTAARMMAAHHIHSVVVKADAELPRIVTDIDIAAAMYDESLERSTALELSHPAVLVRSDDTITYALERLHECAESHAVVAGPGLRLLGVVSVLDLAEWSLREADAPATAPFHG